MKNDNSSITQQQAAAVAGVGYLLIIVLATFAEFFVRTALIVPGNATATVNNLIANEQLFRIGIVSFLVVIVVDVVVSIALYIVFKPVNKNIAILSSSFRLIFIAIKGAALISMLIALELLSGADYLAGSDQEQLNAQVMLFLNAHNNGFLISLVFFGIHCLMLGYLVYRSGFFPKVLGIFLALAALGYVIDSFANFLLPNYADYQTLFLMVVAIPAFIAEISLCVLLLYKGSNIRHWNKKTPAFI